MHGHQFLVLDMGEQPDTDSHHNNSFPPFKDTVTVPSQGFVIIKFRANNPGLCYDFFHFKVCRLYNKLFVIFLRFLVLALPF
jgi:FtsP/CotA-like multicopper oxidase with cupredoxin domain